MGLHCNSEDDGVSLSWHTDQPIETFIKSGQNGSYLLVFLKRKQAPIQFTCISRTNTDNSTSAVSLKCEGEGDIVKYCIDVTVYYWAVQNK